MSEYFAKVQWARNLDEAYIDNEYSRGHTWSFDGGMVIQASSSPHIVPIPYSIEENVDPEEAFIASLSSCHMLFVLSIAAQKKFVIDQYSDDAMGIMGENNEGKVSMHKVVLRPKIEFSGKEKPTLEQIEIMHHQAHDKCFIANSVKTEIVIEVIS